MELKKILCPTDFSRSAQKALPHVRSLTKKYNAEIHVLYVIEDIANHKPWYGEFGKEHTNKIIEHGQKLAQKRLEQIVSKYLEGCPMCIRHVAMGDPAQEILKFIDQEKVDIVVMPTRGEKGIFPFGSVTEKIVKNSLVPVMTIPVQVENNEE